MEAILDTNFIISCLRRKIDFIGRLRGEGFSVKVPREVMQELKDLRLKPGSHKERANINMALKMIEENKEIKKVGFGQGTVDEGLIKMGKKGVYIATLDAAVKRIVPNKIVISDAKNDIVVERS